jgi:hypothetical protein
MVEADLPDIMGPASPDHAGRQPRRDSPATASWQEPLSLKLSDGMDDEDVYFGFAGNGVGHGAQ